MKKFFSAAALFLLFSLNAQVTDLVIFPADWQNRGFTFLENYPATLVLQFLGDGKTLAAEPPIAVWEVPAFLRLRFVATRARWAKLIDFTAEPFTENGRAMVRYRIPLPGPMLRGLNPKRYNWRPGFNCVFSPVPGSAGKNADFRFYFLEKGKRTFERNYRGVLLPSVKFPSSPLKYFKVGVNWIVSSSLPDAAPFRQATAFWRSFDPKPFLSGCWENFDFTPERNSFIDRNYSVFAVAYATRQSTVKFPGTRFADLGFLIDGKVVRPGVPLFVDAAGKKIPDAICPRYLIADPEGLFWGEYFKRGFNATLTRFPGCRDIWLDYEPFVTEGTCDDCLKDFARFAKLSGPPKREEIRDGRPLNRKWREFKAVQHRKILEKFVAAAKKHFPQHRLHLCTATPGGNYLFTWHCVDSSTVAGKVYAFNPMNYTTGRQYFENVEKQERTLGKTRNFSWVDPSEDIERFYQRYSGPKLLQNLIATAALGADGFVIYPTDILDGTVLESIARGLRGVKEVEEVLFRGKDRSANVKYRPVNVISAELENEKGEKAVASLPDFSQDLKVLMKEKDDLRALTLLNYSQHDIFVRISLPNFPGNKPTTVKDTVSGENFVGITGNSLRTGILVKIPREGARLLLIGGPASPGPEVSQGEIDAELKKVTASLDAGNGLFRSMKKGGSSLAWMKWKNSPIIRLSRQQQYLLINPGTAEIFSWRNGKGTPVGGRSPLLGRMQFFSPLNQGAQEYRFAGAEMKEDSASVKFLHTVPKDAGFGDENPLAGLQVEKEFILKDVTKISGTLVTRITFRNPGKASVRFGFRIQHIPLSDWAPPAFAHRLTLGGKPVDYGLFYVKEGAKINWSEVNRESRHQGTWEAGLEARWYKYAFNAPQAGGFYSWSDGKLSTAEHLFPDQILEPGGEKTFISTMKFNLK